MEKLYERAVFITIIYVQIVVVFLMGIVSEKTSDSLKISLEYSLGLGIVMFLGFITYFKFICKFNLKKNGEVLFLKTNWTFIHAFYLGILLSMSFVFVFINLVGENGYEIFKIPQHGYEIFIFFSCFLSIVYISRVNVLKQFFNLLSFGLGFSGGTISVIMLVFPETNSFYMTFLGWLLVPITIVIVVKLKIIQKILNRFLQTFRRNRM